MSITKRTLKTANPVTGRKVAYLVRVENPAPDPKSGKRRWRTRQVGTHDEAKALQAEWTTEFQRGTALEPTKTTVGALLDEWLRVELPNTVRPENREVYEIVIRKHLKPALGSLPVQKLTTQHVETLLADMQERGLSSSLRTKTRMRLSSALKLGMRWGIVGTNVADAAKAPRITYKKATIWTPEQVGTFLATAKDDGLWPLWLLMVETGARTSELLGLAWDDVNLDAGTLRVGRLVIRLLKGVPTLKDGGKSKAASRTIRLTPGTVAELRADRKRWAARKLEAGPDWNPDGLLFTTRSGKPLSSNNLRRTFDALVTKAGVPAITPHAIRKTAITTMLANGASPKAVASRVGHADSRVTLDVYSSITSDMDDALLDIVTAIMPARSKVSS